MNLHGFPVLGWILLDRVAPTLTGGQESVQPRSTSAYGRGNGHLLEVPLIRQTRIQGCTLAPFLNAWQARFALYRRSQIDAAKDAQTLAG